MAASFSLWVATLFVATGRTTAAMSLHLFEAARANLTGARCLDGSPAGYYVKEGDPSSIVVFLQGGGYCNNIGGGETPAGCGGLCDCRSRTKTQLGSSSFWPTVMSRDDPMLASFFPSFFPGWTHVFVPYCSGDSWTGTQVKPVGDEIYFGGHNILAEVLSDVSRTLPDVREFVLSGCSAGGIGTFVNVDFAAARFPNIKRFVALPFSGWFQPFQDFGNDTFDGIRQGWQKGIDLAGSQGSPIFAYQGCIARNGNNSADCWMAPKFARDVQTPMFIVENQFDKAQLNAHLVPEGISAAHYIQSFGAAMRDGLLQNASGPSSNGVFAPSCMAHCNNDKNPEHAIINSTDLVTAFHAWYTESAEDHWNIEACLNGASWPPCGSEPQCRQSPHRPLSMQVMV